MDHNAGFEEQNPEAVLPWLQEDLNSYWNLSVVTGTSPFSNPTGQQAWMQFPPNVSALIPEQNQLDQLLVPPDFNNFDWNLDFPVEVDVSAEPAAAAATTKPFNCIVQGCNSKGFMRKYELERHMKKHNRTQVFPCPVGGCQFSQPTKAFYRRDKLQSHLRNVYTGYQAANTGASAAGPATAGPAVTSG